MIGLSENDLEALRILWEEPSLKASEIQGRFGWEIDNGTLRSVLLRLVERGHVRRRKCGKAFLYSPVTSRSRLLRILTQQMAHYFAAGSRVELLQAMIGSMRLSPKELGGLLSKSGGGKRRKRQTD